MIKRRHVSWVAAVFIVCLMAAEQKCCALSEYTIDFKTGAKPGNYEHGLLYANIPGRAIEDGVLKLNIEHKDAKVSVVGKNTILSWQWNSTGALNSDEFYGYGAISLDIRVCAPGLLAGKAAYAVRCCVKTDKGKAEWRIPVEDLSGAAFHEYRVDLEGNPAWKEAKSVSDLSLLFSPDAVDAGALTVEIRSIRLSPSLRRVVNDKLALVDETRILFLNSCVPALARHRIVINGLEAQIQAFKDKITTAKSCYSNDINGAYAAIKEAGDLHAVFEPRITMGLELVALKERIEGIEDVARLYAQKKPDGLNAAPDMARLKKEYDDCVNGLKDNRAGLAGTMRALDAELDAAYKRLDERSPYKFPVRLGLSQTSFGRFGWMPPDFGEGLLVYNLMDSPNALSKDFNHHTRVILSSEGYRKILEPIVREEKTDVNWVSYRRNTVFRTEKGKEIHWDWICSLLAPGVVLKTDALDLLVSQKRQKEIAPTHVVIPSSAGCRTVVLGEEAIAPEMSENWLLFLWQGHEKYNPLLLVFEKKPESLKTAGKRVSLCRSDGIGHVGVVDYAGVMFFDHKEMDAWLQALPESVAAKCRRIAAVMMNYPVRCKEFYGVDEENRRVWIRNEMEYYRIEDEWGTQPKTYAPLPPLLSFFKDKGYPVTIGRLMNGASEVTDFEVPTKYGPYRAVSGGAVEYEIPLPDFDHRCYLRADGKDLTREKAYRDMINKFGPVNYQIYKAPAWNVLEPERRRVMLEQAKMLLQYRAKNSSGNRYGITDGIPAPAKTCLAGGPLSYTAFVDRIEPYTLKYYYTTGWATGEFKAPRSAVPRIYGDNNNGAGMNFLQPYYYYAKYSGDWQYIRENWPFIKKISSGAGRLCDWANLAFTYFEHLADNHVDMGPDILKLTVSLMKLSETVGDRETYLLAAYIASKQTINRVSFFSLGDYMQQYSEVAQTGDYCLDQGVGELGCEIFAYANSSWQDIANRRQNSLYYALLQNIWSGCEYVFIEDYDAWSRCFPDDVRKIAFEKIPKHVPNWYGVYPCPDRGNDFICYGSAEARYLLARAALGEDTEDLWFYFNQLGFGFKEAMDVFAVLQGRDAPLYLIAWEPNRLVHGAYDFDVNRARLEIDAVAQGTVRLKSWTAPGAIRQNGEALGNSLWQYDAGRQELILHIQKVGRHVFEMEYPGWKKPAGKHYAAGDSGGHAVKKEKSAPPPPANGKLNEGLTFYVNFEDSADAVVAAGDGSLKTGTSDSGSYARNKIAYADGIRGKGLISAPQQAGEMSFYFAEGNVPVRDGTISFWLKPNFAPEDMKAMRKELETLMEKEGRSLAEWHTFDFRLLEAFASPFLAKIADRMVYVWSYRLDDACRISHYLHPFPPRVEVSFPYQKDAWMHLATTWTPLDRQSVCYRFYRNGELFATETRKCDRPELLAELQDLENAGLPLVSYLEPMKYMSRPVDLIKKMPEKAGALQCIIDELRIYGRALTAEDVRQLYNYDLGKK